MKITDELIHKTSYLKHGDCFLKKIDYNALYFFLNSELLEHFHPNDAYDMTIHSTLNGFEIINLITNKEYLLTLQNYLLLLQDKNEEKMYGQITVLENKWQNIVRSYFIKSYVDCIFTIENRDSQVSYYLYKVDASKIIYGGSYTPLYLKIKDNLYFEYKNMGALKNNASSFKTNKVFINPNDNFYEKLFQSLEEQLVKDSWQRKRKLKF